MIVKFKFVIMIMIFIFLVLFNTVLIRICKSYSLTGSRYETQSLIWSITSCDFDGDKKKEIVLGGIDHYIYVMDAEGKDLWKFDVGGVPFDIATGDINGNGKNDIIIASLDHKGTLYALEYKKGILWQYSNERPFLSVAVGDIDADGKTEIVAGSFAGMLYVLNERGGIKWKKQIVKKSSSIGAVAIGDIGGSNGQEIVCGTRTNGVVALDAEGNTIWFKTTILKKNKKRGFPLRWVRSVIIDDINGDGKNEVISGSRPNGMVTVMNGGGEILWNKNFPKLVNKTSNVQISIDNITGDKKKEIVCLLHGFIHKGQKRTSPIVLLEHLGDIIYKKHSEKNFFSTHISNIDNSEYSKILLSSSRRGHYFYQMGISSANAKSSQKQLFEKEKNNTDEILKMANKLDASNTVPFNTSSPSPKIHVILRSNSDLKKAYIEKLAAFLKKREAPELSYEMMITQMYETRKTSKNTQKQPKFAKKCSYSQQKILQIIKVYETLKMPFFVVIGKACQFHMSISTMEKILQVAPKYCRGFMANEDIYSHDKMFETFIHEIVKIMDMLLKHEKKLILDEFLDFWIKVPTMPTVGQKLFNKKYNDVLVPMYKTNRFITPELNIGMIIGLWKAGLVKQWGFCAQDDLWKWESIYMNPPDDVLLRMEVMAASLGATYFRIEAGREFIEQRDGEWVVSEGAKKHRDLFHTLVRNDIIKPVYDSKQLIISPVMLQVKYDSSLMPRKNQNHKTYWQDAYKLEGALAYKFPLQTTNEDYLPSFIYDMKHFYDGLFPKTPYGFIGIVPEWVNPLKISGIKDYLIIDGQNVYKKNGKKYDAGEVKERLLDNLRTYQKEIPFQTNGIFLAINEIRDGYILYLIDSGHLDISNSDTDIKINLPVKNPKIIDAISGNTIKCKNNKINITVPAGSFRIFKIHFPKHVQIH